MILIIKGSAKVITFRKQMMPMMCAAGVLCSGGGALAQTIYKQIDATGRVMFTDRPAAGIVVPYATFLSREGGSVSPPRSAKGVWSDLARPCSQPADFDECRYHRF
jgi:hypothetical protein